jgi:hypothetical protein
MADLTSNQVCNICCIHYNAGLRCCALGTSIEGGTLFAKQGSVAWIVAPAASQVSRTWYNINDAVTSANNVVGSECNDWFVPSLNDLVLGYTYRSFWDSFSNSCHWSSTEACSGTAWQINFACGCPSRLSSKQLGVFCVRAFRRVFY